MSAKIIVNYPGSLTDDQIVTRKQKVADALGIMPEDVVLFPGLSIDVVEVPDALTAKREKADREAKAAAEKAAHEQAQAEKAAAEKAAAEAKKAAPPEPVAVAVTPHAPVLPPAHTSKKV